MWTKHQSFTSRLKPFSFKLKIEHYLLLPAIILLVMLAIYPLIYSLVISLHDIVLVRPSERAFVGLQNYKAVMQDSRFIYAFGRTLYFTILSVGCSFVLGLGIALLLNREIKGKSFVRTCLVIPMVITPVVVGYIFMFMLDPTLGVINAILKFFGVSLPPLLRDPSTALTTLAMIDVWQWTPFVALVLLAGLESLPHEPFEAAQVEGASGWQIFRHLTMPMLKPTIAIAIFIRLMDAFRAFDVIYITTKGGPGLASETLPVLTWRVGFSLFHISISAVMGLIMLFTIMVLSWILFKKVVVEGEEK